MNVSIMQICLAVMLMIGVVGCHAGAGGPGGPGGGGGKTADGKIKSFVGTLDPAVVMDLEKNRVFFQILKNTFCSKCFVFQSYELRFSGFLNQLLIH